MNPVRSFVLLLIRGYQLGISPLMANRCRFYPSCSSYATEAITLHGILKGGYLTCLRLLRCHPFHAGGYDPVPGSQEYQALNQVDPDTPNRFDGQ
ncbi:membrane protein insertion efficiency factor YidD [Parendozoicomonas haliclonae]|uniref:Putative membrane protein insertion efficiency factor n=1 Tax=Parendozoicomonas haliclonae TaxID=1960125 RepID=A0A1X7AJY9_9GAMM|nr:membrane protein insertion efficiency factor YidD [Parendozoicomonas haliclonae]SMA46514.1 putative membrane protein insertion efficiency factor [Parendozoicomonas haliclonae]